MIERRNFLSGALALLAAPAIVRADSIMKIAPIDVYDTRCLWDYDIYRDEMVIRVDRSFETLVRPTQVQCVSLRMAKAVLGDNHPIFTAKPEIGRRSDAQVLVSSHDLVARGFVPPWNVGVQERFI